MADRSLILDANILIRAVLGPRVHGLIKRYAVEVDLFAPDSAFLEVEEHLPRVCASAELSLEKAMETYDALGELVQELPAPVYGEHEAAARARIEKRDPDDWPVVACALALDCPIWTEDRDFFGAGVPTWTTDRVELFFINKQKAESEQIKEEGGND